MYEIREWNQYQVGKFFNQPITVYDPIVLDETILEYCDAEMKNEIIDVEFTERNIVTEKKDIFFAIFSGAVSAVLDMFVGSNKKEIDLAELKRVLPLILNNSKTNEEFYEDEVIEECFSKVENEIRNSAKYVELIKDFATGLSYRALFISIIKYVFSIEIGLNADNKLTINRFDNPYKDKSMIEKAYDGFIIWFVGECDYYKEHGKFNDVLEESIGYKLAFENIRKSIVEFSKVMKRFNTSEITEWLITRFDYKSETPLIGESLAIQLNAILVHGYLHVKNFMKVVKEYHVDSMEGLQIIDFNRIDNAPTLGVMMTVSSGVFAGINVAYAAVSSKKPNRFASKINISNIVKFVVVFKNNKQYFKPNFHHAKIEVKKAYKEISKEELGECFGLNKAETCILYSLKLHLINEDIQSTKNNKIQILKNKWKKEWMELIESSLQQNKIFEDDYVKTYKALLINKNNKKDDLWLYNIAIELALFKPYYRLNDEDEYKKLKLVDDTYIESFFCKYQEFISIKEMNEIKKSYGKYYGYLDNNLMKLGVTAIGVTALALVTGGTAYAFAPEIAVALFGGAFPALHGAALTNAALAFVGGGSLAAGGLGMAGGTMIIAGGGALLGLGGATTVSVLLSAPKMVQNDYANLLLKCDYVLLKKMNKTDEVYAIQKNIENDLVTFKIQLSVLENSCNNSKDYKEKVKNLKMSIQYAERTNSQLMKLLKK